MGIFAQIQPAVREILEALTTDKDLRVVITYRKYTGRVWSDDEGAQVDSFTDVPTNAVRLRHTASSKLVGVGKIQVGDQLYLIDYRDSTPGMSLKDEVLDEFSAIQKVKSVVPIFGLAVAITIEGGSSGV